MERSQAIGVVMDIRKDWIIQDFTDAYADEWDEVPASIKECMEMMEEHIHHKYEDDYLKEVIDNEYLNIDGVEILGFETVLYGEREDEHDIDLGGLYFECEGRKYALDVIQSYSNIDAGFTTIKMDLEVFEDDEDEDDLNNLTATDLYSSNLKVEFYIRSDLNVETITLFVRRNGCTRAIDVTIEE
jgi:hypothetical protein